MIAFILLAIVCLLAVVAAGASLLLVPRIRPVGRTSPAVLQRFLF